MTSPTDTAASVSSAGLPIAARRHDLVTRVARRLREPCGVPPGARLVVGVSGGADSVGLLLAAAALRTRTRKGAPGLDPVVVHVHHHLRPEADEEAAQVQRLCAALDIACSIRHVHPGAAPGNLAAAARRLRYAALAEAATALSAAWVAVAHHVEDQLETILMGLCRGGGLAGPAGMPWRRDLTETVTLVRPLLDTDKAACEDLCRCAGVAWSVDPGNADPATPRGRLRRDVLPVLEALWPGAARHAADTAEAVRVARTFQETRVTEVFGGAGSQRWPRSRLAACPVTMLVAGLRRAAVDALGLDRPAPSWRQLDEVARAIRDETARPRTFHGPGGLRLTVTSREVQVHVAPTDNRPSC